MRIEDLLCVQPRGIFEGDYPLKSHLIALDGKDGKVLFDTSRNKQDFIEKYYKAEVSTLWADCKKVNGTYGDFFKPVMKCFVYHNSWERSDEK